MKVPGSGIFDGSPVKRAVWIKINYAVKYGFNVVTMVK